MWLSSKQKKISLILGILLIALPAIAQTATDVLNQTAQTYGVDFNSDGKAGGLMGFSIGGIIGGLIFSAIGFIAFSYGKKNSEFPPMAIGVALLVYPYFVQNTIAIYIIGVTLTAALYFFRA